mgnify:CR=1 FL=1
MSTALSLFPFLSLSLSLSLTVYPCFEKCNIAAWFMNECSNSSNNNYQSCIPLMALCFTLTVLFARCSLVFFWIPLLYPLSNRQQSAHYWWWWLLFSVFISSKAEVLANQIFSVFFFAAAHYNNSLLLDAVVLIMSQAQTAFAKLFPHMQCALSGVGWRDDGRNGWLPGDVSFYCFP